MNKHQLKTVAPHFQLLWDKKKTFEIRKDDRNFQVGDLLFLREYDVNSDINGGYTGRCHIEKISHILRDAPEYGLAPGYCIISFEQDDAQTMRDLQAALKEAEHKIKRLTAA